MQLCICNYVCVCCMLHVYSLELMDCAIHIQFPFAALSMEVLYIIIGISVVMLVAVVIMVICVALACLRNRRISKRAAGYLESSVSLVSICIHSTRRTCTSACTNCSKCTFTRTKLRIYSSGFFFSPSYNY